MNPLLLLLLQSMQNQNQNQQNPLFALLGNQNQDPTQQLIAALSNVTGQQQNGLSPQLLSLLTTMQQPPAQQNDVSAQLLQMLLNNNNQSQPDKTQNQDLSSLLKLLQGDANPPKEKTLVDQLTEMLNKNQGGEEEDILTRLQKRSEQQSNDANNEAELADAIKFELSFEKFMEDNEEILPDWFNVKEVKEDVDKWAKTPIERAQGLSAATVRAFFKNEEMLDLLEERDRQAVKDKITNEGIKSHEINRREAWPLLERAIFNKNKFSDQNTPISIGKEEKALTDYEARFKQGQQTEAPKAANE